MNSSQSFSSPPSSPPAPARHTRLTRRDFLRLSLLAAIAAGVLQIERMTQPAGAPTYLRWLLRGWFKHLFAPSPLVALAACPSYDDDILGCLRTLWTEAELPSLQGKRVLIKPNLVDSIENHPATTAPQVVGALIDLLLEQGVGSITVGDGPAFRRDALPVAQACGLSAVLAARRVPFVDLNYDDPQPVPVRDGWLRRSPDLWLPKSVLEADYIISLPKAKTHHWAVVSLSVKNMLGVVPGIRYGWPKNMLHINGFVPSILGVYQLLPPVLAVVDGIIGMEGDGPLFGTPLAHGFLAAGADPLAVDAFCAGLMGFSVDDIEYLGLADWAGLGLARRYEIRGALPEPFRRTYRRT